jgi:hypothetical protein
MNEPTSLSPSGFGCKIRLVNHTSFVPFLTIDGVSGAGSATPDATAVMSIILLKAFYPV